MARAAVIGEPLLICGYGLAGAVLCPASDHAEAVRAWAELPADIEVVVLTASAARWLASNLAERPGVLPVVLSGSGRTMPAQAPAGMAERERE